MKNDNIENSIAITGISCRFPGANNVEQLWQNLAEGICSIEDLSDEDLRQSGVSEKLIRFPGYVKRHGGPEDIEMFDANFFGISPDEARFMDIQHRLMLECAYESLEKANINLTTTKDRIGVFGGIAMPHYWIENLRHEIPDVLNEINQRFATNMNIGLGNDRSYASSRISNKLNLQGPAINIDAACATSMFAIHLACRSLLDYESDAAIAASARIHFPYKVGFLHEEGGMSSAHGDIYSFDRRANGTMFTSGAASIILKRAQDAIDAGDDIIALIRGSAINNDGNDKVGFTAPSLNGQRKVIFEAQSVAEVDASEISYIEAHGTGTSLGDPLEFAALKSTFENQTQNKDFCYIGTLKPNLGHMEAVSGLAGVIKTALMLQRKKLLPIRNYQSPNPELELADSPFKMCTQYQDWQTDLVPRKAGVSSFGVGGNNGHVILEEYIPQAVAPQNPVSAANHEIVLLSAKTSAALEQMRENIKDHLANSLETPLRDVAYTSQFCRQAFGKRNAFVASDTRNAVEKLQSNNGVVQGDVSKHAEHISFLFPGQGSQHLGMAQDLYLANAQFRDLIDHCAQILQSHLDPDGERDIRRIMFNDDPSDTAAQLVLDQTQYAQPALFVTEYCLAKWWMAHGVQPNAMIGHSVGEYVAACLAGVFSLESALSVVAARGRLMQGMEPGTMLSVNLSKEELLTILPEDCDLAAYNAPNLTVVSAPESAIEAFCEQLQQQAVSYSRLHTSHAFHSRMMEPMLGAFKQVVEAAQKQAPDLPFISNVTGDWITPEQATSADYWVNHLRGTVNFSDGIHTLVAQHKTMLVEVGSGNTLSQLCKKQEQVSPEHVVSSQGHVKSKDSHHFHFRQAVATMWCRGVDINWQVLYPQQFATPQKVSLPTYAFDKKRYLIERLPRDEIINSVSAERLEFERWFSSPNWQRDVGKSLSHESLAAISQERWLVWASLAPLCQSLIDRAVSLGVTVVAIYPTGTTLPENTGVEQHQLAQNDFEAYSELLNQFKQNQYTFERVISCWALDELTNDSASASYTEQDVSERDANIARQLEHSFYLQMNIVKALDILEAPLSVTLLTNGIASVSGSEQLQPAKASLLGILRVAPLEFKNLSCQLIDVDLVSRAVKRTLDMVTAEIALPEQHRAFSAIRGNYCWRQHHAELDMAQYPATEAELKARAGGTYIITGGSGGIGLLFANWLAEQSAGHLVLVGRSQLPEKAHWPALLSGQHTDTALASQGTIEKISALQSLQEKGATVRYVAMDVMDADAITTLVNTTVNETGQLNGIIHSAGVAGDGIISLKTKEKADKVIRPKVLGALNLVRAVRDVQRSKPELALDFMVLNSSLYAVVGGVGQVDYCAANNILDAIAAQQSSPDLPVLSIDWGPWENLGMTHTSSTASVSAASSSAVDMSQYEAVAHPLVKGYRSLGDNRYEFVAPLSASDHWILDEHRIEGEPVVPGTSLIEMFIVIGHTLLQNAGQHLVLENVLFVKPIAVPQSAGRLLTLLVEVNQNTCSIAVQVSENGVSAEYAMADVRLENSVAVAARAPETLKAHYDQEVLDYHGKECDAVDSERGFMQFGERWHSIKQVRYRDSAALNQLALPQQYASDVEQYLAHPALLDLGTGIANGIWLQFPQETKTLDGEFLPSGYDEVHVYHSLPAHVYAESQLASVTEHGSISFNIHLLDTSGRLLMDIKGFRINHVAATQSDSSTASPSQDLTENLEDKNILPQEGIQAFSRLLGMTHIQSVVVSSRSLEFLLSADEDEEQANDGEDYIERPDVATEFVPTQTETQEKLVALWTESLGVRQIGIYDNFYDVGGDSLVATKLVANIRRRFDMVVALKVLFDNPTVAELGDYIDAMLYATSSANLAQQDISVESDVEREEGVL